MEERVLQLREVSEKEFKEIINNNINVRTCPVCKMMPQMIIYTPFYRQKKIIFKCTKCGVEKAVDLETEKLFAKDSFGTPVTIRSLALSIANAIQTWNRYSAENQEQKGITPIIK